MIAGVLLAAGRGTRFGGANKLLAKVNDRAVVRWSAMTLASVVDEMFAVVPVAADELEQALARLDVTYVVNFARDEGMASSIRAGIAALPEDAEAAIVALGDQPAVDADVLHALVARWREGDVDAVAPMYTDGRGNPVLFGRACFASLAELRGDAGARELLGSLGDCLALVPVDAPMPLDVDTREALETLQGAGTLKAIPKPARRDS